MEQWAWAQRVKVVGAVNQVQTAINLMVTGTGTVVTDLIKTVVDTLCMVTIEMVSHLHLPRLVEDQPGDIMIGQTLAYPLDHHYLSVTYTTVSTAQDQIVAMGTALAHASSTESVSHPEVDP